MLVSFEHKFIFIKNKKVAGTSLEILLSQHMTDPRDVITPISSEDEHHRTGVAPRNYRDAGGEMAFWNHYPAEGMARRLPPAVWNSFRKITSERHPYEKAVSIAWYTFFRSGYTDIERDFAPYLRQAIEIGDYLNFPRYCINGKVVADTIVLYENLQEDTDKLMRILGLPPPPEFPDAKTRYRKDPRPASDVLTQKQKAHIQEVCAAEFDYFGWER